jgi:outer membrane protein
VNALIAGRKAAKVDALRTEVKLSDLRQRLLREKNTLAVQRQALVNLLGAEGPGEDFALAGSLEPPVTESRSLDALSASALENRSDARAAQAELDAQGA